MDSAKIRSELDRPAAGGAGHLAFGNKEMGSPGRADVCIKVAHLSLYADF